jgi:hypothetical protein
VNVLQKIIFLFIFTFQFINGLTQSTDTTYHLQVFNAKDSTALPFSVISVDGRKVADTDIDGKAVLTSKYAHIKPGYYIKVVHTGYSSREIILDKESQIKILKIYLDQAPILLDEIEIVDYQVPLIDPDKPSRKHRKEKLPLINPNPIVAHSEAEINEYETLKNKTWEIPERLKNNSRGNPDNWAKNLYSLRTKIHYPEKTKEAGVQEKIYFKLMFNPDGFLEKIELEHGKDLDLVITTAKALASLPGITLDVNKEPKQRTKLEIILPVRFRLN